MSTYGYLVHHGIKGQKWGVKNGPPYPLDYSDHNSAERKSNSKTSLSKYNNHNDTKKSSSKSSGSSSSADDPTSTYDRLSESVKNFMNKSTNELDNASKEVGKQITDAIDKNTPVKDFIDRTKVVYKNEIDTYKNKKDAKSEMKEAKKEQKEAAKEYLKTQNKLAIKYALADSKYSTREAALNAIMAGTGTMPLKYATSIAARGTQLYANYAFNKGRKAAGKEPLAVNEFDELLEKRNGVNPFNNPMSFTRIEALYKAEKSNKHKELKEKNDSDYESLQAAKANYKEKKQAYKNAKEEHDLAKAWTTNKAKYKYLTAETPEEKEKYKKYLKAEDAITKYVALKGGKKIAKKAVGLGTIGAVGLLRR